MGALVHGLLVQRQDDLLKIAQREVDELGLLQDLALDLRLLDSLGSSKIDQVELRYEIRVLLLLLPFDGESEYAVRARRGLIQRSAADL